MDTARGGAGRMVEHLNRQSCCIQLDSVKIQPRKACRYPNLRSFGWVSYDKVGGLYSGKSGI